MAALVLPDYTNFGKKARAESMQTVAQALRDIANDAHAEQLLTKTLGQPYVWLDRRRIAMHDGFPAASEDGIIEALQLPSGYTARIEETPNTNTEEPTQQPTIQPVIKRVTIHHRQARLDCQVQYQEAKTTIKRFTPSVSVEVSGC